MLLILIVNLELNSGDVGKPTAISEEEEDGALETMKFNFNIESLGLVLYNNDPIQVSQNIKNSC